MRRFHCSWWRCFGLLQCEGEWYKLAEIIKKNGVPNAESSRSVRGLRKGVSGKPYPRLCNTRRPRLEPRTFRLQAVRLYHLHQARPSLRLLRWIYFSVHTPCFTCSIYVRISDLSSSTWRLGEKSINKHVAQFEGQSWPMLLNWVLKYSFCQM